MSKINLTRVAQFLREKHGIENAEVEQTGGGTATLFAGPVIPVPGEGYCEKGIIAGPGNYDWTGQAHMAWTEEFTAGRVDTEGADHTEFPEGITDSEVAQIIAGKVNVLRESLYRAALDEMDRKITAHEFSGDCPAEGPDACDECDRLYSKRANIHTIYGF